LWAANSFPYPARYSLVRNLFTRDCLRKKEKKEKKEKKRKETTKESEKEKEKSSL